MSQLDSYIRRYGELAGPKLYHAIRSRSAYMGANHRRRAAIARLTDVAPPARRARVGVREDVLPLPFGPDGA